MKRQRNDEVIEDASKRRALSTIDLNYPYSYQPTNTTLNPPLIDPNGPLYDNGGKLTIAVSDPIVINNKRLAINYDSSLDINNRKLGVNVDTEGPLDITDEGLNIRFDDTLHVDEWELGVKLDPAQPLDYSTSGLKINLDETLLVSENEHNQMELGVHLNPDGPLNADDNGLDIDIDDSLQITRLATPSLGIKIDTNSPLKVGADGLNINIDEGTMEIKSGKLSVKNTSSNISVDNTMTIMQSDGTTKLGVKINKPGVIAADTNGIKLLFNNNDFLDDISHGLSSKTPITYLSPYCVYECGSKTLTSFTSRVRTNNNATWECSYYVFMANSSGVVNATMMFLLDKQYIINIGNAPNTKYTFRATFVLNPSGNYDVSHSQSRKDVPSLKPENSQKTKDFFIPSTAITAYDCKRIPPISGSSYYISDPKGQIIDLYPRGQNYDWNGGHVVVFPVIVDTSPTPPAGLVLSFYGAANNTQNWYQNNFTGQYYTGPFSFSYNGRIPDYSIL